MRDVLRQEFFKAERRLEFPDILYLLYSKSRGGE